jgi:hypothetical protein
MREPDHNALRDAFEVTRYSIPGTQYYTAQAQNIFPENSPEMKTIRESERRVLFGLESKSSEWDGKQRPNDFANSLINESKSADENIALKAVQGSKITASIKLGEQVGVRYLKDNEPVAPDVSSALNDSLIINLAQNQIRNEGGKLYDTNEKGDFKLDEQGKPIASNIDTVKTVITDEEKGFSTYMRDKGVDVAVDVQTPAAVQEQTVEPTEAEEFTRPSAT